MTDADVILLRFAAPLPWAVDAACRGVDPALFFPERGEDAKAAKAVCATCPVRQQCLDQAVADREAWGIWGGMTADEHRRLVSGSRRALPPINHGSAGGYRTHKRRGEWPCPQCRAAYGAYQRRRRAAS